MSKQPAQEGTVMAEQHGPPRQGRWPSRIMRKPEVTGRTGLSGSTIDAKEAAGGFPRRVAIGPRSVGWIEAEVEAWIECRVAESRDVQDAEAAKHRPDPNAWIRRAARAARQPRREPT